MTSRSVSVRLGFIGFAAVAAVILAACSSSTATAAPGATAAAGGGSSAAPSSAVVPGFSLPSNNKDLEGLLPDNLCDAATIKTSESGSSFAANADPAFTAVLTALGKTAADVEFAFAIPDPTKAGDCKVSAGIFEINGADSGQLQTVFLASAAADETTYTPGNVGGKDVYVDASDPTSRNYFYIKGDAVIFASAPDDATAATVLSTLP
jgi:hypothetical protein